MTRALAPLLVCACCALLAVPALAADEEPPEGALPPKPEDAPATAPIEKEAANLPDSADIQAAIAAREADVQACARPAEDGASYGDGRVLVGWRIEPDGAVTDVRITENTTGSDALAECFARLVGELRFQPTPSGKPARVSYPFRVEAPARGFWAWLTGLFGCG